tara:strand:+ start:1549 stop:2778 length:1230 start_codon:yes stop_codon:yes gene_type:complete
MEVGELHDKVIYELNKPFVRIKGFGQNSNRKGVITNFKKADRKLFKKEILEEYNTLKYYARRFDIDGELERYIAPRREELRRNPTKICNLVENTKLPFDFMWIEFKSEYTNLLRPERSQKPKVIAIAVNKAPHEPNNMFFHFYHEDGYFPIGYKIYGEGEETALQNMMNDSSLSMIEREDNYRQHSALHSKFVYGMPPPDHYDIDEQWADSQEQLSRKAFHKRGYLPSSGVAPKFGRDLWESFAHEKFRYQKLLDRTAIFNIDYYMGTVNKVTEELMEVAYLGMMLRFALVAIETLNYPWVQKEQKMRVVGKKSKTPRIVPHDHYYKAKIVLPKEEVVEIERNTPREDFYGMRQHQVRGHWRVLKNEFGEVRKRIWIDSFVRGNPKLGIVYKDYVLEGDKQKIKEETKC